jgi:hypothetical protein
MKKWILITVVFLLSFVGAQPLQDDAFFIRGDSNSDGKVEISDAIATLNFLFLGGPPPLCQDAADANDDGVISIIDSVYTFNYLFSSGPQPEKPFPGEGADGTLDILECKKNECTAQGACTHDIIVDTSDFHPDPDGIRGPDTSSDCPVARIWAQIAGPSSGQKCNTGDCKGELILHMNPILTDINNPIKSGDYFNPGNHKTMDQWSLDHGITGRPVNPPDLGHPDKCEEYEPVTDAFLEAQTGMDITISGGNIEVQGPPPPGETSLPQEESLGRSKKSNSYNLDNYGESPNMHTWSYIIPIQCSNSICNGGSDIPYVIKVRRASRQITINYKFKVTGLECCGIHNVEAEIVGMVFEIFTTATGDTVGWRYDETSGRYESV